MKKLLVFLIAVALSVGTASTFAGERNPSGKKHQASQATEKGKKHKQAKSGKDKKKIAKAAKKGKLSAKKNKKLSAKNKKSIKSKVRHAPRISSEAQESRLRMSSTLASVPPSVYNSTPESGEPDLRSAAVLVIDQETGEALYAKNPDIATPIASITKLMTSMVVLDAGLSMYEEIDIDEQDVDRLKHTSSRLALGTRLSREELLNLALIASENRAASALGRSYPGGREAFIRAMNRKASALGMNNTWFVDSTGLDSSNRSTAADLAKLVNAAHAYPTIRRITRTGKYDISVPGYKVVKVRDHGKLRKVTQPVIRQVAFSNTNALTRNPDWEIGVSKTGYINEAGHCLVMQTRIADRPVIMVLLDSWGKLSRIGDANRVRKWLEHRHTGRIARLPGDSPV